jgi:probable phosphoglycerate mutase
MNNENKVTRFGLIRHAPTLWNEEKRIQGRSDTPLTSFGKQQARLWGEHLKDLSWNRVISSDAGRAKETAVLINIALQVPLSLEARLREQDWGDWTGKTIAQIKKNGFRTLNEKEDAGWNFCPPDGEDRISVWKRSQQALKDMGDQWKNETLLLVTHEGVIKCLIYKLLGRQFLASEPPILKPDHLHWLSYNGASLDVERINAIDLSSKFRV